MKSEITKRLKTLFDRTMAPKSVFRTLVDRQMPHFDRLAHGENAKDTTRLLSGLLASSAKGTGSAAAQGARDAMRKLEGARTGSVAGALLGGAAGATREPSEDGGGLGRWLLDTAAGAAGGAGAGMLGAAGRRGLSAGAKHFGTRLRGWDELTSMGVLPTAMLEGNADKSKGMIDRLRTLVRDGDKATVGVLGSGDNSGGSLFSGPFGRALTNAGIKDLDAGYIINPDVARGAINPAAWRRMQTSAPGLKTFRGRLAGLSQLDLGNEVAQGPVGERARLIAAIADEANATLAPVPKWTPRRSTDSLWDDIKNRKKNAPRMQRIKDNPDALEEAEDYIDMFVGRGGKVKGTGLTREQMMDVAHRRAIPGNLSSRYIWDASNEAAERGQNKDFVVDLTKDLLSQAPNAPVISVGRL